MSVQNGGTQSINGRKRISPHPHQMRRIKVRTNNMADFFAQTQLGWNVLDQLIAVKLNSLFLYAKFFSKFGQIGPIWMGAFFPLVFQHGSSFRGP